MLATERRYLRPPLDWMPKAWATAGDAPRPLSTKSGSLEILSPGMIEGACKLPGVTAVIAAFPLTMSHTTPAIADGVECVRF